MGRRTVKKNLLVLMAATVMLCIGLRPASASLIGMPLHLKAAIDLSEVNASNPACQFYTDDVFAGPLLVRGC
jgi:hypothetical protein